MEDQATQDKIGQLQLLEQNMQQTAGQKQQFQTQLFEIETALKEIGETEQAYKIVGSIMVSQKKEDLEKDLKSKKEMLELRIKTLEKQEDKLKEKAKAIQEEVFKNLKKE